MSILLWIVLGALAGWLASIFMASSRGLPEDIILGIVGSFVGGFIMELLNQPGITGFNLYSLLVSFLGAVVLIYLSRVIRR